MKTLFFSILLIFILLTSCEKEVSDNVVGNIAISAHDQSSTLKTTLFSDLIKTDWVATTDQIGVYCLRNTTPGVNVPYTATTSGHTSGFTGSLNWISGESHQFYAYYPYVSGSPAHTAVPVGLSATQTIAANTGLGLGAYDFMYSNTAAPITPVPSTVNPALVDLSFKHLFNLLQFDIVAPVASLGKSLVNIVLTPSVLNGNNYLTFSGGFIDLTTGLLTIGTKGASVTSILASPVTLPSGTTKVFMLIHYSETFSSPKINITLNFSDNSSVLIQKNNPSPDFVPGTKYVVTLTGI